MRSRQRAVAAAALLLLMIVSARRSATADVPFTITASTGGASARVDATVTRNGVTLPAAVVPFLREGDLVRVDFADFKRPHASWNYLVDVAFISAEGKIVWLFPKDVAETKLFSARGRGMPKTPAIQFVYGRNGYRGVPIFLIVPEDKESGGLDAVRSYVAAHPNDFLTAAVSSEDAVDQQGWMTNFLAALQNGAINPFESQAYIESLGTSLGASQSSLQACYVPGASTAAVSSCVYNDVAALDVPTNYNANTVSGFFGSALGSSLGVVQPLYSLAIKSALTVWSLFHGAGHDRYEYLPSTLQVATQTEPGQAATELLRTVQAPTLRPPAALSDVLFFSIGGAGTMPPSVERDGTKDVCVDDRIASIPLHLSHTSVYVHDAELYFAPADASGKGFAIPLDARSTAGPLVSRALLARHAAQSANWTVTLRALYGFTPLEDGDAAPLAVALPHDATWTVIDRTAPEQQGKSIDLIAMSSAVPCLTAAEIRQGRAASAALSIKAFAPGSVALHAELGNGFEAGPAQVVFVQDDPLFGAGSPEIVATHSLRIGDGAPEVVTTNGAATAYAGDRAIALTGSHFDAVDSLRVGDAIYAKSPASTSTEACFTGPLVGRPATPGMTLSAQLVDGGDVLRVFPLTVRAPRPLLATPVVSPSGDTYVSTAPIKVTLTSQEPMPLQSWVDIRRAPAVRTPCDASSATDAGREIPQSQTLPVDSGQVQVTFDPEGLLGNDAFGTLQVQLVDGATKAHSPWVDLPGRFVRGPSIVKIQCAKTGGEACELIGTELDTIDEILGTAGEAAKAPFATCPSNEAQDSCIYVPRLQHYAVRSIDGGAPIPIDDGLIEPVPRASPSA